MCIRDRHKPAQLRENGNVPHALRHKNFLIFIVDPLADGADVALGLLRPIVHAHAAGQVHESDVAASGVAEPHRQAEQMCIRDRL